jgi:HD-GYP domain-containing protein (c-di-GMP phosphodiesterase class II)
MHVAAVAARFAAFRQRSPQEIAGSFYAAALHRIGAIRVVVPRDASARNAEIMHWDGPAFGAAIVTEMGVFPPGTADAIRWHRESFDGTGYPDRLRWNGIPEAAMEINIVSAFVAALEDQAAQGGSPADAVFTLVDASGTVFKLATMRDFRTFLAAAPDSFDAPYVPEPLPGDVDAPALVAAVCASIDERQPRTNGRGDRLERIVRAIVAQLGQPTPDADRAAFAARLTAVARIGRDGSADDAFGLSRLGLESRAAQAQDAVRILATAPGFAEYAPIVGATEEWYDGSGLPSRAKGEAIDRTARILAVALAAEAVTASDARSRIAAAGGTRLDPQIVAAYLAAEVKR